VRDPKVFLFDEPLSNLDAALRVQTRLEIARLHQRLKTTMIYVTHDQVEAMTLADKIVVLRAGRIEQVGTPIDLYERPANTFVAQFIGSPKMNFFGLDDLVAGGAGRLPRAASPQHIIGLRPESLIMAGSDTAVVQGRLDLVENLGEYALVHLITQTGVEFIAKTETPPKAAKGDILGFAAKAGALHLFDRASGARVD
jgi:ABC-type sugar transport system ATPase subunit